MFAYCKSLKFWVRFISCMNGFCEIKYNANILAVHCNNITNAESVKLFSKDECSWGKPQNIIPTKYKAFKIDIRPYIMWTVSLVNAGGHFPQWFVWECISYHTHFITLECNME